MIYLSSRRMVSEAEAESARSGQSVASALDLDPSLGGAEVALQVRFKNMYIFNC
jgi:hypothetical protein